MAAERINIFSHKQDVAGIAALLRQLAPNVIVTGVDNAWERITVPGPKSWFRTGWMLSFNHDPTYYSGPNWPRQVAGMQVFIGRFPDAPRKPDVLRLIGTFRFALATEFAPELVLESNDPRLTFLFAVARHVDGVLFTPSGLWDAAGRRLLGADGRSDPNAVLPAIPEAPPQVAPAPAGNIDDIADEDRTPPDPRRVLRRALCLVVSAARALIEMDDTPPEQTEAARTRILAWTSELALEDELEAEESKLLHAAVGSLTRRAAIDAAWRLEGLAVLAWALGEFELPPYDRLVDPGSLFLVMGFLNLDRATALLSSANLRAREELVRLQKQYFVLHWRLRNFRLDRRSMDFKKFARECWFGPLDISLARLADDDLAIGDAPIAKASPDEFQKASSIANERHRAINWLVDGGDIYSETDTST